MAASIGARLHRKAARIAVSAAAPIPDAEILGRQQVREYARFIKDWVAGCEDSFVNDTGVQVGVRQTRQGKGRYVLHNDDMLTGAKFADGIAKSRWPIELHAGEKPRVHWLLNDFYEVPYRCFVPEQGDDLLFAGRYRATVGPLSRGAVVGDFHGADTTGK